MLQRLLWPWLSLQPSLQLCRVKDVGGDAELGSVCSSSSHSKNRMSRKSLGSDLVILSCMWAGGEFSSLSGQAYRPRGPWCWAWRKEQEGGLGLHGGKSSSGPGARSEKASERRAKVEGLGQGQEQGM